MKRQPPNDTQPGSEAPRTLTDEQLRLIELVAQGWTDSRIASDLNMSIASVQRRLRALVGLLGASSRASLAARAVAMGLISPSQVSPEFANPASAEAPDQGKRDAN